MLIAGDQVPVMPLLEMAGSVNEPPEQIGATCVKVGVTFGFTVTVIVVVEAQGCSAALGVKV